MARVKKKVKKEKTSDSNTKLHMIIGGVAAALAVCCIIAGLVIYLTGSVTAKLYKNSRDMDYETLVEMYEDRDVREKYEGTMYVLVFHSNHEDEAFADYKITDSQNIQIKTAITNDLKLNEKYDDNKVEQQNRYAFYAVDLMDSDNDGLSSDDNFGYSKEAAYILVLTNTSSGLSVKKQSLSKAYLEDTINSRLTSEYGKY